MPMAAPPVAPNSLTFVERGLETMDGTPLPDADRLRVIGLISSYTLSEGRMANDAARAAAAAGPDGPGPWSFEGLLRELVDSGRYPRLHRIVWSDDGPAAELPDEGAEFVFGLDRILDGIEAYMERVARAAR
jgi:hypothetical protein